MRLILARHAETIENLNNVNQGQMNGSLTGIGRIQASHLGRRLSEEKIDIAFISDLRRCVQTAEHILVHHPNIPVYYDRLLRERNLGVLQGSAYGEVAKHAEKSGVGLLDYKPKGGESINEMKLRVRQFIDALRENHTNKNILIVSHGQYIANIILYVLELDDSNYESYKQENTAVSIIVYDEKPVLQLNNSLLHLDNNF